MKKDVKDTKDYILDTIQEEIKFVIRGSKKNLNYDSGDVFDDFDENVSNHFYLNLLYQFKDDFNGHLFDGIVDSMIEEYLIRRFNIYIEVILLSTDSKNDQKAYHKKVSYISMANFIKSIIDECEYRNPLRLINYLF